MLAPKKAKHRKWQTGRKNPAKLSLPDTRGITLAFGSYGLKAMTPARVTSNQIVFYINVYHGRLSISVLQHTPQASIDSAGVRRSPLSGRATDAAGAGAGAERARRNSLRHKSALNK